MTYERHQSLREVRYGEQMTGSRHLLRSLLTSGPGILWVTVFLLVPLLAIVATCFMTRGEYGEIQIPLTLENFRRFMGFGAFGFDPLYPLILLRSLTMGAATAALCLLLGLPLAFFVAGLPERRRNAALVLIIVPFWTNLLIRTYAWQIMLAPNSVLTRAISALGLSPAGSPLCPSAFAVYLGMVCDYLPFMALPLYVSVEKLDWSLADAARDLGANRLGVFRHALLPQISAGVAAGVILVFIPATGQFVIPDILGGSKTVMLGNAIAQQFGPSRDWPFGSTIAAVSMGIVMLGLWIYARMTREKGSDALL